MGVAGFDYIAAPAQRGTVQPKELGMEPCEVCGVFIMPGSKCSHAAVAAVKLLQPPLDEQQ